MDETMNNTNTNEAVNNTESNEKTSYTKEEVEALLQRETDRRVTSALKKAEQKNAEKLREAEKLSQMNAEQKFQYELEQREKAIIEKEKALALAENKNVASKILSEKGLSLSLVDFVVAEEAEEMNARIKLLDKAFKESIKKEVESRLGNKNPSAHFDAKPLTKESFKKLSLREQQEMYINDPELYKSMVE